MTKKRKPSGYSRLVLLAIALLLPGASLIPLGTLWLWEHGYLAYWAIGTCLVVLGAYYLQRRLIVPVPPRESLAEGDRERAPADVAWTALQAQAWEDVQRLADSARSDRLSSRDAALSLALETIEAVARRVHPERADPLLQFTVPEALVVIERTSRAACTRSSPGIFRSATGSPSPRSCGSTAGAGRSAWRRRATTCGASCACSIPSRRPRRSCASASRARSTRWGASTWPGA
jgi:hypothetical protein